MSEQIQEKWKSAFEGQGGQSRSFFSEKISWAGMITISCWICSKLFSSRHICIKFSELLECIIGVGPTVQRKRWKAALCAHQSKIGFTSMKLYVSVCVRMLVFLAQSWSIARKFWPPAPSCLRSTLAGISIWLTGNHFRFACVFFLFLV